MPTKCGPPVGLRLAGTPGKPAQPKTGVRSGNRLRLRPENMGGACFCGGIVAPEHLEVM